MQTHGEKMSYPHISDAHFMQKTAELMAARHAILEWSADQMPFPRKLLKVTDLLGNYKTVSLYGFMA